MFPCDVLPDFLLSQADLAAAGPSYRPTATPQGAWTDYPHRAALGTRERRSEPVVRSKVKSTRMQVLLCRSWVSEPVGRRSVIR